MPEPRQYSFDPARYSDLLREASHSMSVAVNDRQLSSLLDYLGLLVKWNRAFNLTAVRDPKDMLYRHLVDSLSVVPFIHAERILDVGTGPGLPGIPLAIMYPDKEFVLLDSNSKKTRFLTQARIELQLANIQIEQARVETLAVDCGFDQIVSRAFTSINNMIDWCEHLLTTEGEFIAMKGPLAMEEWQEVSRSGFVLTDTKELSVPGCEASRQLIIIRRASQ